MNIEEIMERDIADAERQERERAERETSGMEYGWIDAALKIGVGLAALAVAFAAGVFCERQRELNADRIRAEWHERVVREAKEAASAMSIEQLLEAGHRGCDDAANRQTNNSKDEK